MLSKPLSLFFLFLAIWMSPATGEKTKRFVDEMDVEQALINLRAEFSAYKTTTDAALAALQGKACGSTFVRWGKNDCTKDSEMMYRGYLAGKRYDEPGSSSDSLCLPDTPTWANYTDVHDIYRSTLYGAEIDVVDPAYKIFGKPVWNQDMPCAVCRTHYATTLMVPARTACYPGWVTQYSGYLVSNVGTSPGSYDMVCLDGDPDFVAHGGGDDNQHVLYLTEAHCGSLACPPYVENRELACSVCSK